MGKVSKAPIASFEQVYDLLFELASLKNQIITEKCQPCENCHLTC